MFKLEGVLEQRLHAERLKQRELATAQHALLRVQAELDSLEAMSRLSAADLRVGKLTAPVLIAHQQFAVAMRHKGAALRKQVQAATREHALAQSALMEAAKQRKVIEKLRERELNKWFESQKRREAADADEVGRQLHHAANAAPAD